VAVRPGEGVGRMRPEPLNIYLGEDDIPFVKVSFWR
jgi:hypothetical protein